MTIYDYDKFVHPVPSGHVIPKGTQVQLVNTSTNPREVMFFTTLDDLTVPDWKELTYYLNYDITRPTLPEEIASVIYNVRAVREVFPVAVYQGRNLWCAFSKHGGRLSIYTPEIESFDATPPKEGVETLARINARAKLREAYRQRGVGEHEWYGHTAFKPDPRDEADYRERVDDQGDVWRWGVPSWSDVEGWWTATGVGAQHGPMSSLGAVCDYTNGDVHFAEEADDE